MKSGYQYFEYLGNDFVRTGLRVPRKLYNRAQIDCDLKRQSFNKRIVEMLEREFGSVDEVRETVVSAE